jgi:hypothetical protein
MKEKNEKDARNFGEEMKELQRTLDHDEKLKNFLFHKVRSNTEHTIDHDEKLRNFLFHKVRSNTAHTIDHDQKLKTEELPLPQGHEKDSR